MSERDYLTAVRQRVVVFDGGMGATLEQFDLGPEDYGGLEGKCHEALVLNRPDVIEGVHTSMLDAGAEVVETDTFQGSRLKLDEWGLGEHTLEINRRAAEIARRAAGEERYVAGSIGPTGFLPASDDPTLGGISFRELVDVFTEQARGLVEGGADLIIIETAQDMLEVKAAIFGAREAFKVTGRTLPIQTSVSLLPQGGKMLLGTDIQAVLTTLSALDVQVIGLNCSTGPEDMRDAIRYLGETSPLPVHCIPNAGLPLQGPEGETIFPEQPEPLAATLGEFVERYGVGIVGGCCGTTPDHIRAIRERVDGRTPGERPARGPIEVSSMMTSTPLVQEPRPTLVGERVNSQGSRAAKELLLADDYDGLVQVAEDQVTGGAHVLDVCVALTERQDEDAQMRELVKRISLTQPAPIQVDSTEPEVIQTALEQIPGRAVVNSINLEAGRDKLDRVVPLAKAHGAAVIALTIDEEGMAKTGDRKVEVAKRIHDLCCVQHGLDPEALIFDALTFTLTTGDEEWRPSAIETIEGIRRIKSELPGVKTSLGVSNVSFGVSPPARAALNSVFLHHCVEAGLDLAMVNPNHITPYAEIPDQERELTDDLVFNRSDDALERFIAHFEQKGEDAEEAAGDPTEGMEPEEALHWQVLHRRKDGVEDWIDRSVSKIGAVPTLNQVLLPAMKEVGDKFGAGELILPFVLQSAEVMKRAVAQLENYLERIEGHTKGKVVIATVFGDVHDIGKSLVNTILTNNGYTVVDLGKQVPVEEIISAAVEHEADAIGLSALLVSTSKQMPICVQELHERGLRVPRAGRRRGDQPRLRSADPLPRRQGVRRRLRAGRLLLQGRLRRARHDGRPDRWRGPVRAGRADPLRGAGAAGQGRGAGRRAAHDRRQRPLRSANRRPDPGPSLLGRPRDRSRRGRGLPPPRPPRALQAPLGRPRQEGRGVAAHRRGPRRRGGIRSSPRAHVARAGLPSSPGPPGLLPLRRRRQRAGRLRPGRSRARARAARLPAPAAARPDLPDGLLPPALRARARRTRRRRTPGRHRRCRGHRADREARGGRGVRRAALRPRPRGAGGRGPRRVAALARSGTSSESNATRDAATPGAIRPARNSQSTRRSGGCCGSRRSA